MAVGDIRLSTNRYVRPGTYIGRVHQPAPGVLTGYPRFPAFVGKGNRLARESDSRHIRSRVYAETLNFPTSPPYRAPLDHDAANDQTLALLSKSSGEPVASNDWAFVESTTGSGTWDYVQINDIVFDQNAAYVIEYQSVDRAVLDPLQFDDLREIISCGNAEGISGYVEFEDFRVITTLTGDPNDADALVADSSNTYTSGGVSAVTKTPAGVKTGTFTPSGYTFDYSRSYVLTCTAAAGAVTAEFTVTVSADSGGNSQAPNQPAHSSLVTPATLQVAAASPAVVLSDNTNYKVGEKLPNWWVADGLTLTFVFGTGFDVGDVFTFDAYGPGLIEFSSAHDNTNQYSSVAAPVQGGNIVTTTDFSTGGTITVNGETNYDGEFDRTYTLVVDNVGGVPGARTCDILWTGYNELPFSEGSISLTEATASTLIQRLVEKDVYLDFVFGGEHDLADTTNAITAADCTTLASALILGANIRTTYNAHDADTGGAWHGGTGINTHQVSAVAPTDLASLRTFCLELQTDYAAHLADTATHVVADTVFTLNYTVTATSPIATLVNFLNDFKDQYAGHRVAMGFVEGDYWTMAALADRREYTAKDERSYTFDINAVAAPAGTSITTTYNAKTYEGGWSSLTLTGDGAGYYADPYLDLPDNIRLMLRNINGTERVAASDEFTFSAGCSDTVDWSLVRRETETIDDDDIQQDVAGNITGTPLVYYLILNETPTSLLRVKESVSGTALSYTWVTNTPYIYFASDPGVAVQVDYEWRGYEPDPGNSYFITANRKRISTEFNEAIRFLTVDDARLGLYPSASSNDLWIMAEIAFETSFFGGYFIQVASAADNEVFTIADYRTAIDASEAKDEISDLIVLNYFNALAYAKNSVEKMCDPFEGKQRLLWVGTPTGTEVGDDTTQDSLVYLARNTLQFSPQSQGKGNVILIANNQATRTQGLEDGSTTSLTLDGSFIAGHAAALTASFTDPADTILRKDIAAFDEVTMFPESEVGVLGGASIVYLNEKGSGLYEYGESHTVDTTEVALNEISARTQEHYVLKRIRREMNDALIGLVPPSPQAGVLMIQSQLVRSLGSMASANIIAPYGSDEGTERPISPTRDVYVYVDPLDARLYHFGYFFITRLPIKRLFGLYSVNTRFWDNRSLSAGN